MSPDTIGELKAAGRDYRIFSLARAAEAGLADVSRLPFSLKVLLENLLRHAGGGAVTLDDVRALGHWTRHCTAGPEIAFHPSRVLMPDSSAVPLFADLAAMRDAMQRLGGDPALIDPMVPVDVAIDHSVIVDVWAQDDALARNMDLEFARNRERFAFLRWAGNAFDNVRIMPPGAGICHQINVEFFAGVVWAQPADGGDILIPDSLIGMDSHTPMVNGLGVLGWGCGGIEAGAVMLGQPISLRIPEVIGCRLLGRLGGGVSATDLALTVTEALRAHGVVQKFVEFCGPGLDDLSVADRTTVANMAPEYGATVGFFPIDRRTVDYMLTSGRGEEQAALVEGYARAQGLWRDGETAEPRFTDVVEIDLARVEPSVAGPRRPQDRMPVAGAPASFARALEEMAGPDAAGGGGLDHGDIAIAAITSCTNSSNPGVIIGAGLLARNAAARGLTAKPWVKTSFAPGSRVVAAYLEETGLQKDLDALGFHVVGFGCTTCMGNSGPLDGAIEDAIDAGDLVVAAVTSANRNFEGRAHPKCRVAYLASPPLVVAYAIAGSLRVDLQNDPLGDDGEGRPVHLADIWPSRREVDALVAKTLSPELFRTQYERAFDGSPGWQSLPGGDATTFPWDPSSSYIRRPPFFDDLEAEPQPVTDILGARPLAMLGDTTTTDHISPVGAIAEDGTAGRYLVANGIEPVDFNSFAARRVNHHVMMRGTFANIRLRNEMAPGTEGGFTSHMPGGRVMPVFDAAMRYGEEGIPLVVVGGREYGAGSSRDWAAKGTQLLGVRAVIAEGLERIHRANLVGMGVLPLQFKDGMSRKTLGLDGSEVFDIVGLGDGLSPGMDVTCRITRADGSDRTVVLCCRLDTAYEVEYFRHGGILNFVLRRLLRHRE